LLSEEKFGRDELELQAKRPGASLQVNGGIPCPRWLTAQKAKQRHKPHFHRKGEQNYEPCHDSSE
jgi:hypothetical protein